MRRSIAIALRLTAVTVVLFGVIYPLGVWAVGRIALGTQAQGSLLRAHGRVVGSRLIGQRFDSPAYFRSRPSSAGAGYDAMASSASNLGPTSRALSAAVSSRVDTVRRENPGVNAVPVDLVTASASGLDPDISPASAHLQAARVSRQRGLSVAQVRALIRQHTAGRQLGFLGEPRVNVLELNLALDEISGR